jgi:plastocyanin
MRRPTNERAHWSLLFGLTFLPVVSACEGTHSVSLTAEDFRFVPDVVRVSSSSPIALSVYNAGREIHEFDSPVLYATGQKSLERGGRDARPGIIIPPGDTFRLVVAPPAGTYLYICRRKGHANMIGTLIVE